MTQRNNQPSLFNTNVYKELRPKCRCGSYEFDERKNGPHLGLYCSKCGRWHQWIKQSDLATNTNIR